MDLVGAFQLDRLASEYEVSCCGRGSRGDRGGFCVDVDLDVVRDVVDRRSIRRHKVSLGTDERRYNAVQENLRVDQGHSTQG